MSMAVETTQAGRLSLSRVAERTFGLVGAEFAQDYLATVGIMLIPTALSAWRLQTLAHSGLTGRMAMARMIGPGFWLGGLVSLVCVVLVYASLSWGAAERLQGRTVSLGDKLSAGLRATPVLIGIGVLAYFAIVFASLLLLVPGLFLAVCWSLVAPVVAVEQRGVFAGFGRSFELTRGNRWTIFLILLVYAVGSGVLALAVAVLVRLVFGASSNIFMAQVSNAPAFWAGLVVNLLLGGVLRMVGAVGVGVIYSELRGVGGGFDTRRLSDVFA